MKQQPAADLFLAQLEALGVSTIYGNPGTFEQQMLEALPRFPGLRYVMGLQEAVVIGMAIGHARVTKQVPFVQLHASVGLGNAAGMLLEAKESLVPMVVYVGENSQADEKFGGFLAADIPALAKPWCKHVERVTDAAQLTRQMQRAFEIAARAPAGPVCLTIPMDVMEAHVTPELKHPVAPTMGIPDITPLAETLLSAQNPMILIGDGVGYERAQEEVRALSHALGAPVYGTAWRMSNADINDPLFQEVLGHGTGTYNATLMREFDVILLLGAPLQWEIFPDRKSYLAPGAKLLQIDMAAEELGKTEPPFIALQAPIKACLTALNKQLEPHSKRFAQRAQKWKHARVGRRNALETTWAKEAGGHPTHPAPMMQALAQALPENTLIYEEAMTAQIYLRHYLRPQTPSHYYPALSRALGAGWPSSIAAKLAHPELPVAAVSADGTAMYVPQALWTAAHLGLKMTFIVINNQSYRVLKHNLDHFRTRLGIDGKNYPHMDLTHPAIDFVALAKSMGIAGVVASSPEEVTREITESFNGNQLKLIDIRLDTRAYY